MSVNQLEKMWRRMQLVVGQGRIKISNDSGIVQEHQVMVGGKDLYDPVPRISEYGFTSMPLPGCQVVMVFIGGDRSNGAILGTNDDSARLKNLLPGEVALHDDQGQRVYITRAGIVIEGAGKPVTVNGNLTINGELAVTGAISATGSISTQGDLNYHGSLNHI
jgi:phage gp45-like